MKNEHPDSKQAMHTTIQIRLIGKLIYDTCTTRIDFVIKANIQFLLQRMRLK